MNSDCLELTTTVPCEILTELGGGIWRSHPAAFHFVEGHLHKIDWAGFSTRSGEGFGITATVHVLYQENPTASRPAQIRKLIFENGVLLSNARIPGSHRVWSYD